jgi:hypothetical protein
MCRNIKSLFNFEPPASDAEIREACLQFVRKVSGFNKPSKVNEDAFNAAVNEITAASKKLMNALVTSAPAKNRAEEAAKRKKRASGRSSG